jgi:hypothetical protein
MLPGRSDPPIRVLRESWRHVMSSRYLLVVAGVLLGNSLWMSWSVFTQQWACSDGGKQVTACLTDAPGYTTDHQWFVTLLIAHVALMLWFIGAFVALRRRQVAKVLVAGAAFVSLALITSGVIVTIRFRSEPPKEWCIKHVSYGAANWIDHDPCVIDNN